MAYTRPLYLTNPTMKGDDVKEVQIRLNYLGYYQSGIDGSFGPACDKAVRHFQTNNGLASDGSCGPATYNALFSNSAIPRTLYLTNPTIKGDDVVRVQQKLKNLGYYTSSVDGSFGPASKSATIQYQTVNGLDPDGSFGPASHKKLMTNPKPNNSSGYTRALYLTNPTMKGDDVKKVQQRLKDLGYYTDAIDASFGINSDNAVRAFQGKNGLEIDGSCGPATWNKLFSSSAISNSSGSTGPGGVIGVVKKVFIDAGHGGTDPGASGNGISEKNITLSIATLLGNKLKAKGIEVKYTRTTDTYVSLSDRANAANNWGANLFISIHANAFSDSSARGTESYTTSTTNESTKNLSRCISASISNKLGIPNRGHKEANFVVLRDTIMPAVLIETAFITNASDAQLLKNRQNDFVDAIVENINSSNSSSNSGYTRALYLTNPTMKGNDVKKVQQRLKDLGYYTDTIDGSFGPNSRSAVIKFQELNDLQVDGSCGPATWNELFSSSALSYSQATTILDSASSTGIFAGSKIKVTAFSKETAPIFISLLPTITVQAKVSKKTYIGMTGKPLNISSTEFSNVSVEVTKKLASAGIKFDFSSKLLLSTFASMNFQLNPNERLVIQHESVSGTNLSKIIIEHQRTINNKTIYVSLILTIDKTYPKIYLPIKSTSSSSNYSDLIGNAVPLITYAACASIIIFGIIIYTGGWGAALFV